MLGCGTMGHEDQTTCVILPITNGWIVRWVEWRPRPKSSHPGFPEPLMPSTVPETMQVYCAKPEDIVEAVRRALEAEKKGVKISKDALPEGWDLTS